MPQVSANQDRIFQSSVMGGFECATHRRNDGQRVDVLEATHHLSRCKEDYSLLRECGITTIRDGLRWHLIEATPGAYDWSSFLPMLQASLALGVQVIWDLCHWGVPAHVDIFDQSFPKRFADFAMAAARLIKQESLRAGSNAAPFYCPINELSFWSWIGGEVRGFYPYGEARGYELKRQLARASTAAIIRIKEVEPAARFLFAEPLIYISPHKDRPEDAEWARQHTQAQFEAWDIISGRRDPELGGHCSFLDIVGVNYYWNNQWIHSGAHAPLGHIQHRPLHLLLQDVWERYHRPIVVSETGAEHNSAFGWLGHLFSEVRRARQIGVPVIGVCLYPVMDYPGWDDNRHCECGLLSLDADWEQRSIRKDLLGELKLQQTLP